MYRWHKDYPLAYRQWKIHRRSHVERNIDAMQGGDCGERPVGLDPFIVDCVCDEQVGRFRKKDAWDCGKTRCYICHSDKLPKRSKHRHELRSDISFREQLKEVH